MSISVRNDLLTAIYCMPSIEYDEAMTVAKLRIEMYVGPRGHIKTALFEVPYYHKRQKYAKPKQI